MPLFLHLVIVDASCRAALTTRFGSRWMLPVLVVAERARPGPLITSWLRSRGLQGELLGQWLGRMSATQDGLDWLVLVRIPDGLEPVSSNLRPTPLEQLGGSTSLIEYQGWASERAAMPTGVPFVPGPFGDLRWFAEVARWIAAAAEAVTLPSSRDVVWHRLGAYEVVLEWRAANRRWFFKGLDPSRAAEARVTRTMSHRHPDAFARTLALETRSDESVWWLMEASPGISLADRFCLEGARSVARAYAHLQQRSCAELLEEDGVDMPSLDVDDLVRWVDSMFEEVTDVKVSGAVTSAVGAACAAATAVDVPLSWLAPDLDPANVLLDGDNVRFIDLEDATVGPAPLGMATFARRCSSALRTEPRDVNAGASLLDAYRLAWKPGLSLTRADWKVMALVSQVLESRLAWRRVEAKTRRGEIYGCVDSARTAIRSGLTRAIEAFGRADRVT